MPKYLKPSIARHLGLRAELSPQEKRFLSSGRAITCLSHCEFELRSLFSALQTTLDTGNSGLIESLKEWDEKFTLHARLDLINSKMINNKSEIAKTIGWDDFYTRFTKDKRERNTVAHEVLGVSIEFDNKHLSTEGYVDFSQKRKKDQRWNVDTIIDISEIDQMAFLFYCAYRYIKSASLLLTSLEMFRVIEKDAFINHMGYSLTRLKIDLAKYCRVSDDREALKAETDVSDIKIEPIAFL